MTRDTDCKRIVRFLSQGLDNSYTNVAIGRVLGMANPANRISDARFSGAPITDRWVTKNRKRFKLYSLTSCAAGRKWLEQNK